MASVPDLIYCSNGNYTLQRIALDFGFKFGLKLPYRRILDEPLYFADQDWKNPDRKKYMDSISIYKPKSATVLDLEHRNQLAEVLSWAEEISCYVETVIIIPKCTGVISKLPKEIKGKPVRLGFSVPTKYGSTSLNPSAFRRWEVHLLGGAPEKQLSYRGEMNIVSVDCNYHSMKANKFGEYWTGKIGDVRWWRKLHGDYTPKERSRRAFEMSCKHIMDYWRETM